MPEATYLHFAGLKAPVLLDRAESLLPLLLNALPKWPVEIRTITPMIPAFISITGAENGLFEVVVNGDQSERRKWNAVNAICDLLAEMAWEQIRSRPDILCVHGAAVAFAGRLVLFPNSKRAGKSTLTCALARLGQTVFTDDFLPIAVSQDRVLSGIANGAAPRLRLPIPSEFTDGFKAWAMADPGPSNRQYKFLSNLPLSSGGVSLPLGAIVTLERQDLPTQPRLEPVERSAAMESMIVQNFARSVHAGVILKSIEALTASLPCFRLVYHSGEMAAAYLHNHDLLADLPVAKLSAQVAPRLAPQDLHPAMPDPFDSAHIYAQRPHFTEIKTHDAHFMADEAGLAIHRLNPGSSAIWRLLAEPVSYDEIVEVICAAFPDIQQHQIAADTLLAMQQFVQARLIEPVVMRDPIQAVAQ